MKFFLSAIATSAVLLMSVLAGNAAPAGTIAPEAQSHRSDARRVCHHYRWSSQRKCTNARALIPAYRPPLYNPHRYYGGTPHYAIPYPRSVPYHYYPHRWVRYPRYYWY